MPDRNCDMCDTIYTYERSNSKYCSDLCRYNANNAINGRIRVPDTLRFAILFRDGFRCRYCGARPVDFELQLDHVTSLDDGGKPLDPDNLITACGRCNRGKGAVSAALPESVVGVYWETRSYPPDEWVECSRFKIIPVEGEPYYDIEVE